MKTILAIALLAFAIVGCSPQDIAKPAVPATPTAPHDTPKTN